jgi:hypothetical protein
VYGIERYKDGTLTYGTAQLTIAKGRNIGLAQEIVQFNGDLTYFYDRTDEQLKIQAQSSGWDDKEPLPDIPVYVNIRNEKRFFRNTPIKDAVAEDRREYSIHLTISLRRQKALHLYHMIREYKLFGWWD